MAADIHEATAQYLYQNRKQVPEKEFQKWMQDYAGSQQWKWHHVFHPKYAPAGFPDLVLMRPPELMFIELKSHSTYAKVSASQLEWLNGLEACNVEAHLWTPSDIPEILVRLKRPSLPL
jgi:hypothetical protein